jgi:hypothetical protein
MFLYTKNTTTDNFFKLHSTLSLYLSISILSCIYPPLLLHQHAALNTLYVGMFGLGERKSKLNWLNLKNQQLKSYCDNSAAVLACRTPPTTLTMTNLSSLDDHLRGPVRNPEDYRCHIPNWWLKLSTHADAHTLLSLYKFISLWDTRRKWRV